MEIYRPSQEAPAEARAKQELYSSLYAANLNRFSKHPLFFYNEAVPERDVLLMQKLTIGMYPEEIGDKKEIDKRTAELRRMGVDFRYNAGGLTRRECAFIYHFQEGATTNKELAEKLNTSEGNIRVLRSEVEKKLKTTYKPDRTFTPREQELLAHYNNGARHTRHLATALHTTPENIRVLKNQLKRKGVMLPLGRKTLIYLQEARQIKDVRDELIEVDEYQNDMAAAGGA